MRATLVTRDRVQERSVDSSSVTSRCLFFTFLIATYLHHDWSGFAQFRRALR